MEDLISKYLVAKHDFKMRVHVYLESCNEEVACVTFLIKKKVSIQIGCRMHEVEKETDGNERQRERAILFPMVSKILALIFLNFLPVREISSQFSITSFRGKLNASWI